MDQKAIPKYLAIAAVILFLVGLVWGAVEGVQKQALEKRFTDYENRANVVSERLAEASAQFNAHHLEFADVHTKGLAEGLSAAKSSVQKDSGDVWQMISAGRAALQKNDRALATNFANQAQKVIELAEFTVDMILGPPDNSQPGLFEDLARKSDQADAKIVEARSAIATTRDGLDRKLAEQWNRDHGLSLASAYAKLAEAQAMLSQAEATNTATVERGLIDKPTAYDQAVQVINLSGQALQLATDDENNARIAQNAIDSARSRIDSARVYIIASGRNTGTALSALSGAESTLVLARQEFANQNFVRSKDLAIQAFGQAQSAEEISHPPTPTPVPTNTPEPYVPPPSIGGDDDDGGSSGGGGYDPFDSDDGGYDPFGGDDGGGWDDDWGGDDGGGWDDPDW